MIKPYLRGSNIVNSTEKFDDLQQFMGYIRNMYIRVLMLARIKTVACRR